MHLCGPSKQVNIEPSCYSGSSSAIRQEAVFEGSVASVWLCLRFTLSEPDAKNLRQCRIIASGNCDFPRRTFGSYLQVTSGLLYGRAAEVLRSQIRGRQEITHIAEELMYSKMLSAFSVIFL